MAGEETKKGGGLNAIAAWGSLLGGVAAIAALFISNPNLVTVVLPSPAEQSEAKGPATQAKPPEADETGAPEAEARAPATPRETSAPVTTTPPPPSPPASPPQSLGGGITATLLNVASTPVMFTATFRLSNESNAAVMIAGRGQTGHSSGDFSLTDDMGATCTWRRTSANSLGTLPLVTRGVDPRNYTPLAANASTVVTVNFNKRTCTTPPVNGRVVSVSGTFTIVEGETPRSAPASFEGVTPVVAN